MRDKIPFSVEKPTSCSCILNVTHGTSPPISKGSQSHSSSSGSMLNTSSATASSSAASSSGILSTEYCSIHPLHHEFECGKDFAYFQSWCLSHPHLPIYAVIGYVVAIYAGSLWMKSRPAFDLKRPLFLWNATLAAFSIMGAIRTGTELVHVLGTTGFYGSICYPATDNVTSFWRFAFVMSKYAEVRANG